MTQCVNILGVGVSAIDTEMALSWLEALLQAAGRDYVVVCPVSIILACLDNAAVRGAVNRARLVTLDGMSGLATRVGGIAEQTDDGRMGFTTHPGGGSQY